MSPPRAAETAAVWMEEGSQREAESQQLAFTCRAGTDGHEPELQSPRSPGSGQHKQTQGPPDLGSVRKSSSHKARNPLWK